MIYIDCKKYATEILNKVKAVPNKKRLAIISVGYNAASESYIKGKINDCEYCGIPYEHIEIDDNETAGDVLAYVINECNANEEIGGIILQLPLPDGMDSNYYTNMIRLDKDVDGFRHGSPFKPCTPEAIMYLLEQELGDLTSKRALVIGRGKLVGEPIAKMLLDANCTVTIAHSKTDDLHWELQNADIIVSAVGKPNTVNLGWCWNASIVVDVGVNRDANRKLVGDCYNFGELHYCNLKVTPVPKGVGLLTRAMLMKHMVRSD